MDGGRHVGLFGAIGRETKGAFRSLSYDLGRSRRIRRIGVIAVATVAGGVLATGALLREPVPGLEGLVGDGEDAGIVDGWFGIGSGTTEQDAEASEPQTEPASEAPTGGSAAEPSASASPTAEHTQSRGGSGRPQGGAPALVPIGGEETSEPGEEEGGTGSPTPGEGPSQEPTGVPTSEPPTQEPTPEPTSEAPTVEEPSASATGPGDGQATKVAPRAADPQKQPIGG
jgi:hypothetical protein